jgi:hypothetical protein
VSRVRRVGRFCLQILNRDMEATEVASMIMERLPELQGIEHATAAVIDVGGTDYPLRPPQVLLAVGKESVVLLRAGGRLTCYKPHSVIWSASRARTHTLNLGMHRSRIRAVILREGQPPIKLLFPAKSRRAATTTLEALV